MPENCYHWDGVELQISLSHRHILMIFFGSASLACSSYSHGTYISLFNIYFRSRLLDFVGFRKMFYDIPLVVRLWTDTSRISSFCVLWYGWFSTVIARFLASLSYKLKDSPVLRILAQRRPFVLGETYPQRLALIKESSFRQSSCKENIGARVTAVSP